MQLNRIHYYEDEKDTYWIEVVYYHNDLAAFVMSKDNEKTWYLYVYRAGVRKPLAQGYNDPPIGTFDQAYEAMLTLMS